MGPGALAALKAHLQRSPPDDDDDDDDDTSADVMDKDVNHANTTGSTGGGADDVVRLPHDNVAYAKKDYWEERFATETDFDWLVPYSIVADRIKAHLTPASTILVVGCGNSSFSADLYDDGYPHITNVDYAENVIAHMAERHASDRPHMTWRVLDMTDMADLDSHSFDCVLDKAAMDALMPNEGDVWNPDRTVVRQATAMCTHIARVLRPTTGVHLHISFAQPHFRTKYLLGHHGPDNDDDDDDNDVVHTHHGVNYSHKFGWDLNVETIGGQNGGFHYFLYIMRMQQ